MKTMMFALPVAMLAAPAAAGPMQMDVAGVRLGMPMAQAITVLEGVGYRCPPSRMRAMSHAERVADEVDRRRGRDRFFKTQTATSEITCQGRGGEYMRIFFAQPAGGSVVDQINLHLPGDRFAVADVTRQIAAKYGRPTVGTVEQGAWCDPGYKCNEGIAFSQGPFVRSSASSSGVNILAFRGRRAEKAEDAAVMAEADRIAPKSTKPAI